MFKSLSHTSSFGIIYCHRCTVFRNQSAQLKEVTVRLSVCFPQGIKRCGSCEGKTRFLQVSSSAYLKRPQLGATEACVSDLLRREGGAELRGRHTGFPSREWESRITFAVPNKKIPICIGLLKMLLCFCGFFL